MFGIVALEAADMNLANQKGLIRPSKSDQEGEGSVQLLGQLAAGRVRVWPDAFDPVGRPLCAGASGSKER